MQACASCGQTNPVEARFCFACGTPLTAAAPSEEVRKLVTLVFADISGSTAMGERLDPESTRGIMSRYFEAMSEVLERHGGTVEKFIGDAVMAVFGVPMLHEDDALRAVRAAAQMRTRLGELNSQLRQERGVSLAMRVGVNSGEVVAGRGGDQVLVTGDAVNVAARLEQAAAPGEILIGASTERLVRAAIRAEPVARLTLKGKSEEVSAFRLLEVLPDTPGRAGHLDAPLVGRRRELSQLRQAFDHAVEERATNLFTLLGSAGVGKSRLMHEFLTDVAPSATILRGRCLPYGEGITFWPIVEIVHAAAGVTPDDDPANAADKIRARLGDEAEADDIAQRLGVAIGLSEERIAREETFWAVRRFLEVLATERSLVVVLDDLHWAEPTLLELVEHIADWSRDAPILLACVARPELLEQQPGWAGGKLNATTVLLEPLSDSEAGELIDNLIGREGLPEGFEARIAQAAEGNPLFLEEFLSMLVDDGLLRRVGDRWELSREMASMVVPPTIQALVSARLDHLEEPAREAIGRASVVGKVFQRSAVVELSEPDRRDGIPTQLRTLVRRELVRPDRSSGMADEAYRFRHILVRDAAYAALPKQVRATLHERFADWLEQSAGVRVGEYEEIVAYHLEQACRYQSELGLETDASRQLMERAVRALVSGARHAGKRGDLMASAKLTRRAAELLPVPDPRRGELLLDCAEGFFRSGEFELAATLRDTLFTEARQANDTRLLVLTEMVELEHRIWVDPTARLDDLLIAAERALAEIQPADTFGQAMCWFQISSVRLGQCRWGESLEAARRALDAAVAGGHIGIERLARVWSTFALKHGATPADEALNAIIELSDPFRDLDADYSDLLAMLDRGEEARAMLADQIAKAEQFGMRSVVGSLMGIEAATVELLLGSETDAEEYMRSGLDILESIGETSVYSTVAATLSLLLARQGRLGEAGEAVEQARATTGRDDVASLVLWRLAQALIDARHGRTEDADRRLAEAREILAPSDFLSLIADLHLTAADVLQIEGREPEGVPELRAALEAHERKRNLPGARSVRERLDRLTGSAYPAPAQP